MIEFALNHIVHWDPSVQALFTTYALIPLFVVIRHIWVLARGESVPNYAVTLAFGSSIHLVPPPSSYALPLLVAGMICGLICPPLALMTLFYEKEDDPGDRQSQRAKRRRILSAAILILPLAIGIVLRIAFPGVSSLD